MNLQLIHEKLSLKEKLFSENGNFIVFDRIYMLNFGLHFFRHQQSIPHSFLTPETRLEQYLRNSLEFGSHKIKSSRSFTIFDLS